MIHLLNTMLGAQFPNLCFIGGLILFLIGIFDGGIKFRNLRLPKIKKSSRLLSGLMGFFLLLIPTGQFILDSNTLGLFHIEIAEAINESPISQDIFLFSSVAYGKEVRKLVERFSIKENHGQILAHEIFEGQISIYIADIHLKKATKILLFKAKIEPEKWEKAINYSVLRRSLKDEDILLEAEVKEGVEISFNYGKKRFTLKTVKLLWYIFSDNLAEFEILKEN